MPHKQRPVSVADIHNIYGGKQPAEKPLESATYRKAFQADIDAMPDTLRQRLLSVHAIRDQVVPVNLSQPPGVPSKTIFIVRHVPSIVLGLTLLGFLFVRFFRKR